MTRGQDGSLGLSCTGLSPVTPRRFHRRSNRPPFPCFLSSGPARCSPCPTTGEKGGADVEEVGSRAGIRTRVLEGGRGTGHGRGVAERWRDAVGVRGPLWG